MMDRKKTIPALSLKQNNTKDSKDTKDTKDNPLALISLTKDERISKLQEIRKEVLKESNPYQLLKSEKKDLKIVLNTLDYIVQHSDELSKRVGNQRDVFFIDKNENEHAPIHLNNYPSGVDGEKIMLGSLVDTMIHCFYEIKKVHPYYVKKFISKLNGNCIDARTRSAFDYVLTFKKIPTFTEQMEKIISEAKKNNITSSHYFGYFDSIYSNLWGSPYLKDGGVHGFCKQDGVFDKSSFLLISEFLKLMGLKPGNGFLIKGENERKYHHFVTLCQFILFHKTLLNDLGIKEKIKISSESKSVLDFNAEDTKDELLQEAYDTFIAELPYPSVEYNFSGQFFVEFVDLINRCEDFQFFSSLTADIFECVNHAQINLLLNLCIKRLERCAVLTPLLIPEMIEVIYLKKGYTLLHVAVMYRHLALVEKLIALGANVSAINDEKLNPIEVAAKNQAWELVEKMIKLKKEKNNKYTYAQILESAIGSKQLNIAYRLMSVGSEVTERAVVASLELNDLEFCKEVCKRYAYNPPFFIDHDVVRTDIINNKKIQINTLKWFLGLKEVSVIFSCKKLIKEAIQGGDIAVIQLLLSKPFINIGSSDQALAKIDALPNAKQIRELFSKPEIKIRTAIDKIEFNNDYDGAAKIASDFYKECKEVKFDLAKMLAFDSFNWCKRMLVSKTFLIENFELIKERKDVGLFRQLESYLQREVDNVITKEMRLAFPKSASDAKVSMFSFPRKRKWGGDDKADSAISNKK